MRQSGKKLSEIYSKLSKEQKRTLFEFAEFLYAKEVEREPEVTEPLDIPRPDKETVVAAIKRLKKTYPMVQQTDLLAETSDLMTRHLMRGEKAKDIIDEMELIFEQKHKALET